jgi:hypothetical protein
VQDAGTVDTHSSTDQPYRDAVESTVADDHVGAAGQQQQRLAMGIGSADYLDAIRSRRCDHEPAGWATEAQCGEGSELDSVACRSRRRGGHHERSR